MMISRIAAGCFCLIPLVASCALSEEELATGQGGPEAVAPEEIAADEAATPAPASSQSLLGNACRNTDIYITNSRTRDGINTAIDVRSVEYYSASEGKWYSEDLTNAILNFGVTRVWYDEDLAEAENDLITKWRVHYAYVDNGGWSSVVYQEIDTPNETCIADANFELTVQ